MSDWIMPKFATVYPAIYCPKPNVIMKVSSDWLKSGFTLLEALAIDAKKYTLKGENVKRCTRMGITVLKIVLRGVQSFLWLQIAPYGSTGASP